MIKFSSDYPPRMKHAVLCRRILQTKTVSQQAVENQQVYM